MQWKWMVPGLAAGLAGAGLAADAAPFDSSAPLRTPYAQRAALSFRRISVTPRSVPVFGRVEIAVDAGATFDNPFDAGDVALDARIVTPSRRVIEVPGFFYQAYTRQLKNGTETLAPTGKPGWRVRFTPTEPGVHQLSLRLRDRTGAAAASSRRFTVTPGKSPGFVRVSGENPRFFEFEGGKPYFPLGANTPTLDQRGTFALEGWLSQLAKAGGNASRLRLDAVSNPFGLEQPGKVEDGKGIGQYDLESAWRVDQALESARRSGIYLTLLLEDGSTLRKGSSLGGRWPEAAQNARNGGPLAKPEEFWSNQPMAGLFKNKLRYLAARYGASPNVLAWELWSEPDTTDGYRSAAARDWFEEMAEELRKLDAHGHLIATSFARRGGDPAIEKLEDLDLIQSHVFGGNDLAASAGAAERAHRTQRKAHLASEAGASRWADYADRDPKGFQIHDPLWASLGLASTGGAWPRESGLAPSQPLFAQTQAAARFVSGIDWPAEDFKTVPGRVEWVKPPATPARVDLEVETVSGLPDTPDAYRALEVLVGPKGASVPQPVPALLHGVHAHPELHQPVKFRTDLPQETRFEVQIRSVSGRGGGALRITLDGANVLERDFIAREADGQPVLRHAGTYGIAVSAGRHTVQVENVGEDWLEASYSFRDALTLAGPPLQVWSSAGRSAALAWVRPADRTWHRLVELKAPVRPVPSTRLQLPGLASGKWEAELWDTWSGRVVRRQEVTVSKSGVASLVLPSLQQDVAVKLRREGGSVSKHEKPERRREERRERKRRGGEEDDDD